MPESSRYPCLRNHDRQACVTGSLKATFTRPTASIALQVAVHRNDDFHATVIGRSKSRDYIPSLFQKTSPQDRVARNDHGYTSSVQFLIRGIALPTVASERSIGEVPVC